jgi:DNA-binding transcriptional ArsR family regulator
MDENLNLELVTFFKALADSNRLKIIGLLANQSYTVEQLAEALSISASTVSHHLSRLAEVGLVSARSESYYNYYRLEPQIMENMAKRLLVKENFPKLAENVDTDTYEQKVLKSFIAPDGSIKAFPAQEKKFQIILQHVVKIFEPGVIYSEKEVNLMLLPFNKDTASLRRGFIEYKLMTRQNGLYQRLDE